MKTKRDKYDITFSEFIKKRDCYCQRCGKSDGKLECSHIFSRRHQGLRYDEHNAKLLCFSCHRWWHENPLEAVEWLKTIIGVERYDNLRLMAHKPTKLTKFDRDLIRENLIKRIKSMDDKPEKKWLEMYE